MLIEVGTRGRSRAQRVADEWSALRQRFRREMVVFNGHGERQQVEPSELETAPYRRALIEACTTAQAELHPHADTTLAAVHTAAEMRPDLQPWLRWVDRSVRAVIDAAGRWPDAPSDDDVWPAALDELSRASRTLAAAWRGDTAEHAPEPPPPVDATPDPFQLAVATHTDRLEAARPWARVDHRPYDPIRYADLIESFTFAITLPPTMFWASTNLIAAADLAARVAKNADDDTYRALIDEAQQLTPAAAAGALLRALATVGRGDDRADLATYAADAFTTTVLAQDWTDATTWTANANWGRMIFGSAASLLGPETVRDTIASAVCQRPSIIRYVLPACSEWLEILRLRSDSGPGPAMRLYNNVPAWFPAQAAVEAIHAELPQVVPLDKWASDDIDDDVLRLAAHVLYVVQRDGGCAPRSPVLELAAGGGGGSVVRVA